MIFFVVFWVGFSIAVGAFASSWGRSGVGFGLLSLCVSPLVAWVCVLAGGDFKKQAANHELTVNSKICPKCAERVKREALVCRYCGNEFEAAATKTYKQRSFVVESDGVQVFSRDED